MSTAARDTRDVDDTWHVAARVTMHQQLSGGKLRDRISSCPHMDNADLLPHSGPSSTEGVKWCCGGAGRGAPPSPAIKGVWLIQ